MQDTDKKLAFWRGKPVKGRTANGERRYALWTVVKGRKKELKDLGAYYVWRNGVAAWAAKIYVTRMEEEARDAGYQIIDSLKTASQAAKQG